MRRYDDPVEVRTGAEDDPDQFLWRGRLWQVREVVAHWVETGAWWTRRPRNEQEHQRDSAGAGSQGSTVTLVDDGDLLREREVWRVAAARGRVAALQATDGSGPDPWHDPDPGYGVFDLVFSWSEGSWRLARAMD